MDTSPFLHRFNALLPPGWSAGVSEKEKGSASPRSDGLLVVTAPDGSAGTLELELKPRVSAREAAAIADQISAPTGNSTRTRGIVLTRYASGMARRRLKDAGVSYLDLTGNAWIVLDRPAVFIEREGATVDPDPPRRGVQSLKGAKAARIVRALCDFGPPLGVRELARRTDTDPGYVTRVLSLLENEDVIARASTGEVANVGWKDLLLRWSEDYSVNGSNRAASFLAPRGVTDLLEQLVGFDAPYAITGSFAVPAAAQVAPARLLTCYVSSIETAAEALDVRPTAAGANVILLEPFDRLAFVRTRTNKGATMVALTQCVVDLLTGAGREPAQGDALMTWMADHEDAWRA